MCHDAQPVLEGGFIKWRKADNRRNRSIVKRRFPTANKFCSNNCTTLLYALYHLRLGEKQQFSTPPKQGQQQEIPGIYFVLPQHGQQQKLNKHTCNPCFTLLLCIARSRNTQLQMPPPYMKIQRATRIYFSQPTTGIVGWKPPA